MFFKVLVSLGPWVIWAEVECWINISPMAPANHCRHREWGTVVDKQSQPIFKSRIYREGLNNLAILLQILGRILEIRRKTHLRSFSHERVRLAKISTKNFETFDHHRRPNMCQLSPVRDFCLESVVAHTPSCLYELKWSGQTCEGPTKGHPYHPNWDDY